MKKTITTDLVKALRKDPELFYGWQSNIAMAFYDEMGRNNVRRPNRKELLKICNKAANNFLNMLIKK